MATAPPIDLFGQAESRARELRLGPDAQQRLAGILVTLIDRGVARNDTRIPAWAAAAACCNEAQRARFLEAFAAPQDKTPKPDPPKPPHKPRVSAWLLRRLAVFGAVALVGVVLLVLRIFWPPPAPDDPTILPPEDDAQIRVPFDEWIAEVVQQHVISWWAAIAGVLALCGLMLWAWQAWRRRQMQARPDPVPGLGAPSPEEVLFEQFFKEGRAGFRRLLRHESLPGTLLHPRQSIAATIRAGGIPTLRFGLRRQAPEYLLLCQRESSSDHLPLVGRVLRRRLLREQVPVRHYEFFRVPRVLFRVDRKRRGSAEPLSEVLAGHPSAKVLLLMEAPATVTEGAAPAWLQLLLENREVIHLNPRAPALWGAAEVQLGKAQVSSVFLGSSGLARLGLPWPRKAVEHDAGVAFDLAEIYGRHRSRLVDEELHPSIRPAGVAVDLAGWLDRAAMQWLCALALYPAIIPRLTIELGRELKDRAGKPLLSEMRLIALSRLPWLRAGRMPYWLRIELARRLTPSTLRQAVPVLQTYILAKRDGAGGDSPDIGQDRKARAELVEWLLAFPEAALADRLLLDALKERSPDRLGRDWSERLPAPLRAAAKQTKTREVAMMITLAGLCVAIVKPYDTVETVGEKTVKRTSYRWEDPPTKSKSAATVLPSDGTEIAGGTGTGAETTLRKDSAAAGSTGASDVADSSDGKNPPAAAVTNYESPPPNTVARAEVFFEWDKSDITAEAAAAIDSFANQWRTQGNPNLKIQINCYTDKERQANYAKGLTDRQCLSVANYLIRRGIPQSAIASTGYGSSRIKLPQGTRDLQARRADVFAHGVTVSTPPTAPVPAPSGQASRTTLAARAATASRMRSTRLDDKSDKAYDAKDYATALRLNTESCDKGSIRGCYWNGYLYEAGVGVPVDFAKAREWYSRACDLDSQEGCKAIGEVGLGGTRSPNPQPTSVTPLPRPPAAD